MIKQEIKFTFTCDICGVKSHSIISKNKTEARKFIAKTGHWTTGRNGKKLIDVCYNCVSKTITTTEKRTFNTIKKTDFQIDLTKYSNSYLKDFIDYGDCWSNDDKYFKFFNRVY